MEEREIKALCRNLLAKSWPVYLTTIDQNGYPQTRALFNLRNIKRFPALSATFENFENEFTIIIATNTSSTKVQEIRNNPAVSAYYCTPESWHGAMFGGNIEIVEDNKLGEELWQDDWVKYYPKGCNDPDYTILKLEPDITKGWAGSHTFRLRLR